MIGCRAVLQLVPFSDPMKISHFLCALIAGLALGGTGVYLKLTRGTSGNTPPPNEVVSERESKLKAAQARIASLEKELTALNAAKAAAETKPIEISAVASTGEEPVDVNKLIKDAKPLLKSLTSAFEPQRKEMVEGMIKEQVKRMTELAGLNPQQAAALQAHLESLDKANQAKWKGMMEKDINFADLKNMGMNASNTQKAMDEWAAANLTGEQATEYDKKRLTEKSEQITKSANSQVERMDRDLSLDETQKDKVFNILVKTDKNFDPSMQLQGVDATTSIGEGQSKEDAIAAVLNPEQNEKYTAQQQQRKSREGRWKKFLGEGADNSGKQ